MTWRVDLDALERQACGCRQLNCPGGELCREEIRRLCNLIAEDPYFCARTPRKQR